MGKMIKTSLPGSLTLDDLLLCTPYEQKRDRDLQDTCPGFLTEEIFRAHLYSPPKENRTRSEDDYPQTDAGDILKPVALMSSPIDIESFKNVLTSDSSDPMFVRGYAGAGKTTFIRTLLHEMECDSNNRQYNGVIFNLQESNAEVTLFSERWENEGFADNVYKIYSLLVFSINELMDKKKNENENEYKQRLSLIRNNFMECFNELFDRPIETIFTIIEEFVDGKIEYCNRLRDDTTFCAKMHKKIIEFISFGNAQDEFNRSTRRLFKLICVFLYCSSNDNKKHFLLFDNIEHYIEKDVLYDNDIAKIVGSLRDAHANVNDFFSDNGIRYSQYFKVIYAIRDTSVEMVKDTNRQNVDFADCHINVSSFYDLSDIIDKKRNFFSEQSKISNPIAYQIYEDVISHRSEAIALAKQLSSDRFVLDLYNHNKRRAMMNLLAILDHNGNSDIIKRYKYLINKSGTAEMDKAYKMGARSIIKRLLLDRIEQGNIENYNYGYFSRIRAVTNENLGFGYARRVLTYLYNKAVTANNNEEYVGFFTLIREVFESPFYKDVPHGLEEILAGILNILTDDDPGRTVWCQLAMLKSHERSFNIQSEIERQYKNGKDDESYGIRITSAGQTFVGFAANFEYYVCRYSPGTPPLFAIADGNNIVVNDTVIEILLHIREKAMRCIDKVIEFDKWYLRCSNFHVYDEQFSREDRIKNLVLKHPHQHNSPEQVSWAERPHVTQVINSHIGYLNDYRLFLINENQTGQSLMSCILDTIHEYIKKFREVIRITSEGKRFIHEEKKRFHYVGTNNIANMSNAVRIYETQIQRALKSPLDKDIIINGK